MGVIDVTSAEDKRPVSPRRKGRKLGAITMRRVVWAALIVLVCSGVLLSREARGPIRILSDLDFTPENGVVSGSGTPEDPFVIAGWTIDASDADFAVQIRGVTRPFVIQDLEISGARVAGIKVETTRNGRIRDVLIKGAPTGLLISLSRDIWVQGVKVVDCTDSVRLLFSRAIRLESLWLERTTVGVWFTGTVGSELRDSYISADLGVLLELGASDNLFVGNGFFCRVPVKSGGGNAWDDGSRGNFWSGFAAPDADGDGILDHPFRVYFDELDRYPLAAFAPPTLELDP